MTTALPLLAPVAAEERLPGLLDASDECLLAWLEAQGEKPLRARQLRHALLVRGAESFDQMTDLPRVLRAKLAAAFVPLSSRISASALRSVVVWAVSFAPVASEALSAI
jgi:23S rRNA (adenine2503-C2)-methyltransferase